MADGDGPRSFALMQDHLAEFPRDALILLAADRYLFYSGGENRQQLQFGLLHGFAGDYDDDWWFPGQYGFALGECGHYDEAVDAARRSLALNPKNLWAAHTLAHVYADTKNDEKGAAFLGPWIGDFDPRAPMFGHTSWHLALFELGRGRHERAMEIYETGGSARGLQAPQHAQQLGLVPVALHGVRLRAHCRPVGRASAAWPTASPGRRRANGTV